jgi:hypothetical protein
MYLLRMIIAKPIGFAILSLHVLVCSYELEQKMATIKDIIWSAGWLNWVQKCACLRTMRIAIPFLMYYYSIKFIILITAALQDFRFDIILLIISVFFKFPV